MYSKTVVTVSGSIMVDVAAELGIWLSVAKNGTGRHPTNHVSRRAQRMRLHPEIMKADKHDYCYT
jgi:hypothetical protein